MLEIYHSLQILKRLINQMKVKIINKSNNPLPNYKYDYDSGMDIRYFGNEEIKLAPQEIKLIPTGLYIETEKGVEIQIRPRSGLSLKDGLMAILGTIDSYNYKGEIGVIMINLSKEEKVIKPGDRIAQMVCAKVEKMELEEVESLSDSERGEGGFGHTGVK